QTMERQQRVDARGKGKQEKAGLPTISMKTFRNNAEKSTARTKEAHSEKVDGLERDVDLLRKELRLMLCSLTIGGQAPDMIVLDEPTNNLDIQNLEILTRALNEYRGTLLVVAHDTQFLEEIGVERVIEPGTDKNAGVHPV